MSSSVNDITLHCRVRRSPSRQQQQQQVVDCCDPDDPTTTNNNSADPFQPMICTLSHWLDGDSNNHHHGKHSKQQESLWNCGPELWLRPLEEPQPQQHYSFGRKSPTAAPTHGGHRRSRSHSSCSIPLTIATSSSGDDNVSVCSTPLARSSFHTHCPQQEQHLLRQSVCIRISDILQCQQQQQRFMAVATNHQRDTAATNIISITTQASIWEITCATANSHDILWALLQVKCRDRIVAVDNENSNNNKTPLQKSQQQQQREPPNEVCDNDTTETLSWSEDTTDEQPPPPQHNHPEYDQDHSVPVSWATPSHQNKKESVCDSIDALTDECQRYALSRETLHQTWERRWSKVNKDLSQLFV